METGMTFNFFFFLIRYLFVFNFTGDFFNNNFSLQINFAYPFTVEIKTKGFDDISSVVWSCLILLNHLFAEPLLTSKSWLWKQKEI